MNEKPMITITQEGYMQLLGDRFKAYALARLIVVCAGVKDWRPEDVDFDEKRFINGIEAIDPRLYDELMMKYRNLKAGIEAKKNGEEKPVFPEV